jgi:hypothetical protein
VLSNFKLNPKTQTAQPLGIVKKDATNA